MRWPPWSSDAGNEDSNKKKQVAWADSLNATNWSHYANPETVVPTVLLTATILLSVRVYRLYLRRIPEATHVQPGFFRKRSLFGTVTRVGDGDNFHLYHTPGGRLTGWGWLRKVPEKAADLRKHTVGILPAFGLMVLTNCRLLFALPASTRPRRLISARQHNHTLEKLLPGSGHIYWAGGYEPISINATSMIVW